MKTRSNSCTCSTVCMGQFGLLAHLFLRPGAAMVPGCTEALSELARHRPTPAHVTTLMRMQSLQNARTTWSSTASAPRLPLQAWSRCLLRRRQGNPCPHASTRYFSAVAMDMQVHGQQSVESSSSAAAGAQRDPHATSAFNTTTCIIEHPRPLHTLVCRQVPACRCQSFRPPGEKGQPRAWSLTNYFPQLGAGHRGGHTMSQKKLGGCNMAATSDSYGILLQRVSCATFFCWSDSVGSDGTLSPPVPESTGLHWYGQAERSQ